jgi:hypothetical protein
MKMGFFGWLLLVSILILTGSQFYILSFVERVSTVKIIIFATVCLIEVLFTVIFLIQTSTDEDLQ